MKQLSTLMIFLFSLNLCLDVKSIGCKQTKSTKKGTVFVIKHDESASTISIFRGKDRKPILVQNAKVDFRPYLHPIVSPDGKSVLTEFSPEHHKHQTGLYWGFTRVNGRDYFHNPQGDYWQRVSAKVIKQKGSEVKWQTIYNLLNENGSVILTETQNWSLWQRNEKLLITLVWKGEAKTDITIGKYDYGGIFLRMPWKEGIKAEVINSEKMHNNEAEGKRARWIDVGMQVEGQDNLAHIAILDHPKNYGYPQHWRVDNQLGVGSARSRENDWKISKGEIKVIYQQLIVYTGNINEIELEKRWVEFASLK